MLCPLLPVVLCLIPGWWFADRSSAPSQSKSVVDHHQSGHCQALPKLDATCRRSNRRTWTPTSGSSDLTRSSSARKDSDGLSGLLPGSSDIPSHWREHPEHRDLHCIETAHQHRTREIPMGPRIWSKPAIMHSAATLRSTAARRPGIVGQTRKARLGRSSAAH